MGFAAFGCSLDALDAPEKVAMKSAYLAALSRGIIDEDLARDPYDLLVGKVADMEGITPLGRLELGTWLEPRPAVGDIDLVRERLYREFLDCGGAREAADRLREFVSTRVLPSRPLMFGVDHSLTGGVIEALSRELGAAGLAVIVLDSHFDAVPTSIRRKAAMSQAEAGSASLDTLPESYNCGTWLASLLESKALLPENLVVIGPSDHPGYGGEPGEGDGIPAYRESYLSFEELGVKVIPKRTIREIGVGDAAREAFERIGKKPVYISLDADLGAGREVRAVRFLDTLGLSAEEMLGLAAALALQRNEAGSVLAGLDVMEIDVHLADLPGSEDRTLDTCAAVARTLLKDVD
ncbi:MAG: arginase family protein [Actinobacteria bacterium]|nr:arginase family protein [Actinomycetota bacterium]